MVGLTCRRDYYVWDLDENRQDATDLAFEQRVSLQAARESGKLVVPFEFDLHATDPPSGGGYESDDGYIWRMSVRGVGTNSFYKEATDFILQIGSAPHEEVVAALAANETPEVTKKIKDLMRRSGRSMMPHQRFELAQRPQQLEMELQTQDLKDRVQRGCIFAFIAAAFGVVVGIPVLFVALQVLRNLYQSLFGA